MLPPSWKHQINSELEENLSFQARGRKEKKKDTSPKTTDQRQKAKLDSIKEERKSFCHQEYTSQTQANSGREITHLTCRQQIFKHSVHSLQSCLRTGRSVHSLSPERQQEKDSNEKMIRKESETLICKIQNLHRLSLLKPSHPVSLNCGITGKYFILFTTQRHLSLKYRCGAQTKFCISKHEFNNHWQTGVAHNSFQLGYNRICQFNYNCLEVECIFFQANKFM